MKLILNTPFILFTEFLFTKKYVCLFLILINIGFQSLKAEDLRSDTIDILNTKISLDFSNFSSKIFNGNTELVIQSSINQVSQIQLDLLKLTIDSVRFNSVKINFSYFDSVLIIPFPNPLNQFDKATIQVFYHGTPFQAPNDFGGFYWDEDYAFNIGVSLHAKIHNFGKVWFPCFDNFKERSTFYFEIKTNPKQKAICNGNLDTVIYHLDNTKTWCWSMLDPIPSYLAAVSIADYTITKDSYKSPYGKLPIYLAARKADSLNMVNSFIHLKDALSILEEHFGPYEFNKIGYCLVPFSAGAMEHATNISYMQALANGTTQFENIMVHELSHHWFGDLVTCDKTEEMWLNEGFARYCEALFYESFYGKEKYNADIRKALEGVLHFAHIEDKNYYPLSGIPSNYAYSNRHIYEKGACAVHSLRSYMGDALFFNCLKNYLAEFKFKDMNSFKFRNYLATCSGLNLNDFFENWVFLPGFTHFSIFDKQSKLVGAGNFEVKILISQELNNAPKYFQNVPIEISYFKADGTREIRHVNMQGECTEFTAYMEFDPVYIALDFDQKISDANSDVWKKVVGSNSYDFGEAKVFLSCTKGADSSLVRIEHNWVAPDNGQNLQNYHISNSRYWTIDGIWKSDFDANAKFYYNGSLNNQNGYLDNSFITNSEDSLGMLYRENMQSDWVLVDSFELKTLSSKFDKIGNITVFHLKKGQYTFGIKDFLRQDKLQNMHHCESLPKEKENYANETVDFILYKNPTNNNQLNVQFDKIKFFKTCLVYDPFGTEVVKRNILDLQDFITIPLNNLPRGSYTVSLINAQGGILSKKFLKEE